SVCSHARRGPATSLASIAGSAAARTDHCVHGGAPFAGWGGTNTTSPDDSSGSKRRRAAPSSGASHAFRPPSPPPTPPNASAAVGFGRASASTLASFSCGFPSPFFVVHAALPTATSPTTNTCGAPCAANAAPNAIKALRIRHAAAPLAVMDFVLRRERY